MKVYGCFFLVLVILAATVFGQEAGFPNDELEPRSRLKRWGYGYGGWGGGWGGWGGRGWGGGWNRGWGGGWGRRGWGWGR
ncbi:hypothetical protein QR680_011601 [Steinernema hermaphroditum]|uniref:Uncharacterized protein n=1 Tax=Steinernema hermaphroditum TaxID=289476 RepID=A0AA39I1P5_9BILA|nr:hypothetical protein QR680_011601 [Steinernema hermaphroditum]